MVTLTLQDKKTLMGMLYKHYSINESVFIKAIAQNEEEEVELTLKAFSLAQRTQEAKSKLVQEDNVETLNKRCNIGPEDDDIAVVQIDNLYNKLTFIKVVKDITGYGLKEAKDLVDTITSFERIPQTGEYTHNFKPFKIGPNERITVVQWKAIVDSIPGDTLIKWHYV